LLIPFPLIPTVNGIFELAKNCAQNTPGKGVRGQNP
jgi:hypothetical protein